MPSGNQRKTPIFYVILAGLETGVLGGVGMLVLVAAYSAWRHDSVWAFPNLLASAFYGERALTPRLSPATVAGIALHVFSSGLAGVLFGLAIRGYAVRFRVFLLGLLAGVGWYYISYGLVWKAVSPLVPLYSPDRAIWAGHLLFGAVLGVFPSRLQHLFREWPGGPAPGPE
jgi:hypothetical protein